MYLIERKKYASTPSHKLIETFQTEDYSQMLGAQNILPRRMFLFKRKNSGSKHLTDLRESFQCVELVQVV